jgi:hypothetical protein
VKIIYLIKLDVLVELETNVQDGEEILLEISGIKLGPGVVLGAL